jgi:uncharacterized membrane protein
MFDTVAQAIALAIEVVGIGIIAVGAVVASAVFLRDAQRSRGGFQPAYHDYRGNLGRAILLGLEFLVAGDIVGTVVVDPTFESLGVLGLIVLIRTALSFSLEVEIHGHWPWRQAEVALLRQQADDGRAAPPSRVS